MYEAAIELIKKGKAFVCNLSPEEIKEFRGTLKEPGKNSPYRDRSIEENLELFEKMTNILRYPDLMIYLRASVPHLVANIQKRGRDYEQSMPIDYLRNLNHLYEDFIYEKYQGRKLAIDVDNLDFQHRAEDFAQIIDKIDHSLFNLFPE